MIAWISCRLGITTGDEASKKRKRSKTARLQQIDPMSFQIAFLRLVDDCECLEGVFETRGFENQAADLAMEVEERLLADGAIVIEEFGVLSRVVEPDNRVR